MSKQEVMKRGASPRKLSELYSHSDLVSLPSERVLGIVRHRVCFIQDYELEFLVEYRSRRSEVEDLTANYSDATIIRGIQL